MICASSPSVRPTGHAVRVSASRCPSVAISASRSPSRERLTPQSVYRVWSWPTACATRSNAVESRSHCGQRSSALHATETSALSAAMSGTPNRAAPLATVSRRAPDEHSSVVVSPCSAPTTAARCRSDTTACNVEMPSATPSRRSYQSPMTLTETRSVSPWPSRRTCVVPSVRPTRSPSASASCSSSVRTFVIRCLPGAPRAPRIPRPDRRGVERARAPRAIAGPYPRPPTPRRRSCPRSFAARAQRAGWLR